MADDSIDLDFKDDGDWGDFDFDSPETDIDPLKDNRSPLVKLSTSFAQGVKDDMLDRRSAPHKLKRVLPQKYESSIDLADETLGTVGTLYNTIIQETREGTREFKKASKRLLRHHEEKIPPALRRRLDKLLTTEGDSKAPSKEEIQDEEINGTLTSIFELQSEQERTRRVQDETRQSIRDTLERKRHESQVEQLFGIRQAVHRQVTYQDKITARYQRKSLELQYRQYFVTRDLFAVSEQSAKDIKEALQGIVKNTALPDYQKLQLSEAGGQMLRDRLLGSVQDQISQYTQNFFSNARENLVKKTQEKAKGWGDQLSMMAGAVDMMAENAEFMDPYDTLGQQAGSLASGALLNGVAPRVRGFIEQNPRAMAMASEMAQGVDDLPRTLNKWAKSRTGTGGILGFLADSMGTVGIDKRLDQTGVGQSEEPAIYDKLTRRSIVEVIPGYLSRILQEVTTFRRGMGVDEPDPNGRLVFSLTGGDFTTQGTERSRVKDAIFKQATLSKGALRLDDLYELLGIDGDLPDEERENVRQLLGKRILHDYFDGDVLDLHRLADEETYGPGQSPGTVSALTEAVKKQFGLHQVQDKLGNSYNRMSTDKDLVGREQQIRHFFNRIGTDIQDPRGQLQGYLQTGHKQALEELGLIVSDGDGNTTIDYDRIFQMMVTGSEEGLDAEELFGRREQRRYDRYWDNLGERQRNQEDTVRKRKVFDDSVEGRVRGKVKKGFNNLTQDAKRKLGLSDDPRYRSVERATAANRKAGNLPPTIGHPGFLDRGLDIIDLTRTAAGREQLRDDTVQGATQLYGKAQQAASDSELLRRTGGDKLIQKVHSKVVQGTDQVAVEYQVRRLIKEIDPEQKLSKELRSSLRKQLVLELLTGGAVDLKSLTTPDHYIDDIPGDHRWQLASVIAEIVVDREEAVEKRGLGDLLRSGKDRLSEWGQRGKRLIDTPDARRELMDNVRQHEWVAEMESLVRDADKREKTLAEVRASLTKQTQELTELAKDRERLQAELESLKALSKEQLETLKGQVSERWKELTESESVQGIKGSDTFAFLERQLERGRGTFTQLQTEFDQVKAGTSPLLTKWSKALQGKRDETEALIKGALAGRFDHTGAPLGTLGDDATTGHLDNRDLRSRFYRSDLPGTAAHPTQTETTPTVNLNHPSEAGLVSLITNIRDILKGDEAGVTQMVDQYVRERRDSDGTQGEDAQVAVLSRILANVEAIGQMLAKDDEESWFNILDIGKKTGRVMKKVGGALGSYYLGSLRMMGGGFAGIGSLLRGAGRLGGNLITRLGPNRVKVGAMDVYIKGRPEPVMRASDMAAGMYRDSETGETITSIEDLMRLKGEVIDAEGNLVVTPAELSKGIYDRTGQPIGGVGLLAGFGKLVGRGFGLVGRGVGVLFAPLRWLRTGASKLWGMARNYATRVKDVYVKGEEHPRLLATIMKNGGYVSGATGRTIYRLDQIDGDIMDRNGNTVLSAQDMARGLVDKNGQPFGFLRRQLNRVTRLVKGAAGLAWGGVKFGARAIKSVVGFGKDVVVGAGNLVGGGLGIGGLRPLKETGERQLSVLEEIRDILKQGKAEDGGDSHYTDRDGDGDRDGSWQDLFAQRDAKAAEGDAPAQEMTKEKKDSFWSKLLAIAGPIAGAIGTVLSGFVTKLLGILGASKAAKILGSAAGGLLGRGGARGGKGGLLRGTGRLLARGGKGLGRLSLTAGRVGLQMGARALIWAGGAAVAALGAPVVLTGAAVAAVGIGGYLLWKKWKNRPLEPLASVRMLQYGVYPSDKESVAKIRWLEAEIQDHVKFNDEGLEVTKSFDHLEAAKKFGVNHEMKLEVEAFTQWYRGRFLPVFLKTFTATKMADNKLSFDKIEEADPEVRIEYLMRTKDVSAIEEGYKEPYYIFDSPFPHLKRLPVMPAMIRGHIDEILNELKVAVERSRKTKPSTKKGGNTNTPDSPEKMQEAGRLSLQQTKEREKEIQKQRAYTQKVARDLWRKEGGAAGSTSQATTNFVQRQNAQHYSDGKPIQGGQPVSHPGGGTGGDINQLPLPQGDGSWEAHREMIAAASKMSGVDAGVMATMAAIESSFNSRAQPKTKGGKLLSSAKGLYQFLDSTWREMLQRHGSKYGISPNTSQFDPRANALMGAEFLKENEKKVSGVLGRPVTDTDLYTAHFLGPGGARELLGAPPKASAPSLMPQPARANPAIFMDAGRPRTVAEVYEELDKRVSQWRNRYAEEARQLAATIELPTAANDDPVATEETTASTDTQAKTTASVPEPTPAPVSETAPSPTVRQRIAGTQPKASLDTSSPTLRQSVPTSTIDSSAGINEALNRNPEVAEQRRQRQVQQAAVRDLESKQYNQEFNRSLVTAVDVLQNSLTTQRSMDDRLRTVVDLLRTRNGQEATSPQGSTPPPPPATPTPPRTNAGRREHLAAGAVDLRRQRSM